MALLLRDAGWEVEVFERSPDGMKGTGAGITVHEPTLRYLTARVGVGLDDISLEIPLVRYLDTAGEVIWEQRRGMRFSTWGTLYEALLAAFGRAHYHMEAPVQGVKTTTEGMVLCLDGGESELFDLAVGADGVGSGVRAAVLPGVSLKPAGYLSWRGVVDASELSAETFGRLSDAITYCVGNRTHILAYPVPPREPGGETRISYGWYRNYGSPAELERLLTDADGVHRPYSVPPGMLPEAHIEQMRAASYELAPAFVELVQATREPFVQLIGDLIVPRMALDRVVLIGDAACVARPHVASGAAKAAENAWSLTEALKAIDFDFQHLRDWERTQLDNANAYLQSGVRQGERGQVEGTWTPADPTFYLRPFNPEPAEDSAQFPFPARRIMSNPGTTTT
jgi:2,6-dihydroxypyridine 3-monooxygenase